MTLGDLVWSRVLIWREMKCIVTIIIVTVVLNNTDDMDNAENVN